MLTLYPRHNVPPQPLSRNMDRRGRSRQVSHAALARQASEERRRRAEECLKEYFRVTAPPQFHLFPNPTPRSPSSSLSPPGHSPPSSSSSATTSASMSPNSHDASDTAPTLEDQVHIAYALDDIHLAKILLLRLKGIEVTSDDDPRIASVQDEDFDICFVPGGRLTLDAEDEKAVLEAQRRERERWDERRRAEKLCSCEKVWEDEKRRMRIEKLNMLKKKEEQALARAEQTRREEEERRYQHRVRAAAGYSRGTVSYGSYVGGVDQFPGKEDTQQPLASDPFQYPFMIPSTPPKTTKLSFSLPYSNCVPFKEVLASMNGPLFPPSSLHHSPPRPHTPHARAHKHDLLDSLLKVVQWEDGERRRIKGKGKGAPILARVRSSRADSCAACSAASSTSSSSANRWSFGSRSSVSTAATSVSPSSCTSPLSSWLNPSSSPTFSASPVSDVPPSTQLRHSCRSRLTLVDPADCPLGSAHLGPQQKDAVHHRVEGRGRRLLGRLELDLSFTGLGIGIGETTDIVGGEKGQRLVHRVTRSVSSFVDLAKGIQSAYISATVLSITSSDPSCEKDLNEKLGDIGNGEKTGRVKLKPPGYRVHPSSVSIFALPNLPTAPDSITLITPAPIYIPLVPPSSFGSSSSSSAVQSPRTRLPSPLPLQFPPPLTPPRSPLRPRQPPPPGSVLWRMRPVGNPVMLRLKALRNVLWERGVGWEGKGREGGLGAGRERLCRVAVEGRGRSRLGSAWEGAGGYVGVCG